jgi:hypothetical protein
MASRSLKSTETGISDAKKLIWHRDCRRSDYHLGWSCSLHPTRATGTMIITLIAYLPEVRTFGGFFPNYDKYCTWM